MSDLADPELTVLLVDPQVPAGRLAQEALRAASLDVAPDSFARGVGEVGTKVGLGEADAGIVYATDVRAAVDRVAGVDIAPEDKCRDQLPDRGHPQQRRPGVRSPLRRFRAITRRSGDRASLRLPPAVRRDPR